MKATLLVGVPEPFGPGKRKSAIRKSVVDGTVAVGAEGLAGDGHADTTNHGGPDQALHHYAAEHYAEWRSRYPEHALRLTEPGFFGENISTTGMTEESVCVGDRYRLGSAILEVSQGREPCWKLAHRLGAGGFARAVQDSGRTGWFYRVVETGEAQTGDELTLLERAHSEWTIARLMHGYYHTPLEEEFLAALIDLAPLSQRWREKAARRLETKAVESWVKRLTIPGN